MRNGFARIASAAICGTLVTTSAYSQIDWSQVGERERAWIEQACSTERRMGPSYYFPCASRNIQALKQAAPRINWSGLEKIEREWIERSCQTEQGMGPSYYYPCIQRNISAARELAKFDDWYRLDKKTQEWIEGACSTELRMGPAYYYPCLTRNTYAIIPRGPSQKSTRSLKPLSPCPPGTIENLKTTECERPEVSSDVVRGIQNGLNTLGYNAGEEDGRVGGHTRAAISRFQKDNGLAQDGEPSTTILAAIRREVQETAKKQAPRAPKVASSGSGFFVSNSGHIVTNSHVIDGCVQLSLSDGRAVSLIEKDINVDLALIKVDSKSENFAHIRVTDSIRAGESVVAAGFPLAGLLAPQVNITTGVISSTAGLRNDKSALQMTAPVQPGNSGGPLLDERGEVVGVVVGKLDALKVAGVIGDIPQNVNFAVKSEYILDLARRNSVRVQPGNRSKKYDPPTVGEIAGKFTVQVMCWK